MVNCTFTTIITATTTTTTTTANSFSIMIITIIININSVESLETEIYSAVPVAAVSDVDFQTEADL
jgi:hypothetical protein